MSNAAWAGRAPRLSAKLNVSFTKRTGDGGILVMPPDTGIWVAWPCRGWAGLVTKPWQKMREIVAVNEGKYGSLSPATGFAFFRHDFSRKLLSSDAPGFCTRL